MIIVISKQTLKYLATARVPEDYKLFEVYPFSGIRYHVYISDVILILDGLCL